MKNEESIYQYCEETYDNHFIGKCLVNSNVSRAIILTIITTLSVNACWNQMYEDILYLLILLSLLNNLMLA